MEKKSIVHWTKSNVPDINSGRVTFKIIPDDTATGRYSRPHQVILIDGEIVNSVAWLEDDDWSNCSETRPNQGEQWRKFVNSLPSVL